MKKFLAIFTCAENSKNHQAWKQLDQQSRDTRLQEGSLAKSKWTEKYKNRIVFEGSSLGNKTKLIDTQGVQDIPSRIGAFIMIQAATHEDAAAIFLEHPHFAIFPGDGVEVLECTDQDRP